MGSLTAGADNIAHLQPYEKEKTMPTIVKEPLNDRTLLIKLNRPDTLNAIIPNLLVEMKDMIQHVNHSRSIRSLVISG